MNINRFAPKLLGFIGVLCVSIAFTSCEEEEDFLSLTSEETAKAMVGSWKLTKASSECAHYLDDEKYGLTNDLPTSLTEMNITETEITFKFSSPVPLIHSHVDENTYEVIEQEEMVDFIKCQRTGTMLSQFSARRNSERDFRLEFVFASGLLSDSYYANFSLYGKNNKATRIIMDNFSSIIPGTEVYFEFVRQ